jgi:Ran GTPase-activating protein (RanGAP) involved in mRNA processing and transport
MRICLLFLTDIHHVKTKKQSIRLFKTTTYSDCSTTKQSNMIHIGILLIQLCTHHFIQTLTTLDLEDNYIGAVDAQHLAVALRNNTVTLILSSSISYTCLHFFTQTLTTLNLGQNRLGAVGAQHLADGLRTNTVPLILSSLISYTRLHFFIQTLTTLDLNYNQIEYVGVEHLADALRTNTVTLILSSSILRGNGTNCPIAFELIFWS